MPTERVVEPECLCVEHAITDTVNRMINKRLQNRSTCRCPMLSSAASEKKLSVCIWYNTGHAKESVDELWDNANEARLSNHDSLCLSILTILLVADRRGRVLLEARSEVIMHPFIGKAS